MENMFETLQETAARHPGSIALASRSGYMTYEDFLGNIASAAQAATKNGIKPGDLIVLAGANPDAQLIIAMALMRVGCRVGYSRDVGLYDSCGVAVDAVIADTPMPASKHRVITIGRNWFKGAEGIGIELPPPAADFSIIFASSGSTGRSKLVEFDKKPLLHRVSVRVSDTDFQDRPRFMSAMGDRTAVHLCTVLAVLLLGGMIIGPSHRDGSTVLDTIELSRPDFVYLPPSTLVELLRRLDEKPMKIGKVRYLLTSGSRCAPEIQRLALERIAENFILFYGSTETGAIAQGYSQDLLKIDRCVGRVVDGIDAAAFDSDGKRLPPGSEGEIRVKGPGGAFGKYVGDYGQQQSAFRDGWFVTGDIGLVDKERNLIIRGRSSNVINIGGSKVSPEVLEEDIRAFSQVRDVGVSGVDLPEGFEEICAAIVTRSKLTLDDINAHLLRRKARWPVNRVKIVPAIPKTESGKIDRVALRRLCSSQA